MLTRRGLLLTSAGMAGATAAGAVGWRATPYAVRARLGLVPEPWVPDAPEGEVRTWSLRSTAMGGDIDVVTAVPAGYGDGAGLPVVVVLHGASASAAELPGFGLGRFVSAAVEAGAAPFVLVGTDDGPTGWTATAGSDPPALFREELPAWLGERGFGSPQALWGWSRGAYGGLRLVVEDPGWVRALALFSPALGDDDPVLGGLDGVRVPVGIWCGEEDQFVDSARALAAALPTPPEVATFAPGGHTRAFWNTHTLDAFGWLAGHLEDGTLRGAG
ncbi:alpha/beta hydrolase-fold protein [Nocardioides dongkuii]|uniref:alpha/beta hydrolase-fold protein n=1 Tax=Nocardioides dongkuii TaxID=2760089 RepID=UPI0015FBF497|nr:alpha/beta hydrolase-fold protein [Nocardioides dongkuii]